MSHSFSSLTREILFLSLEHKIHIFSPLCNILYIFYIKIEELDISHSKFEVLCCKKEHEGTKRTMGIMPITFRVLRVMCSQWAQTPCQANCHLLNSSFSSALNIFYNSRKKQIITITANDGVPWRKIKELKRTFNFLVKISVKCTYNQGSFGFRLF